MKLKRKHRHHWHHQVEYAVALPPDDRWWVHYVTGICDCGYEHIEIMGVR